MQDFRNKVAVITGGASGVGRALGHALAREGATVVLADIEAPLLAQTVAEIAATGAVAVGQVTDVTDPASVKALADRAFGDFGRVHLVFNNAGVGGGGAPSIWDTSVNVFRWAFEVNFFGPLNGFREFVPRLLEQDEESVIAATASGAGLVFPPGSAAYSSTKAALIALTEMLSVELGMCGGKVRAACLFPGPHVVDTRLFSAQRNLLKKFDDGSGQFGGGITDIESFQQAMQVMIGRRVEITQPEEFADYVLGALRDEKFWIMPTNPKTATAIRARFEGMLNKTNPVIADML